MSVTHTHTHRTAAAAAASPDSSTMPHLTLSQGTNDDEQNHHHNYNSDEEYSNRNKKMRPASLTLVGLCNENEEDEGDYGRAKITESMWQRQYSPLSAEQFKTGHYEAHLRTAWLLLVTSVHKDLMHDSVRDFEDAYPDRRTREQLACDIHSQMHTFDEDTSFNVALVPLPGQIRKCQIDAVMDLVQSFHTHRRAVFDVSDAFDPEVAESSSVIPTAAAAAATVTTTPSRIIDECDEDATTPININQTAPCTPPAYKSEGGGSSRSCSCGGCGGSATKKRKRLESSPYKSNVEEMLATDTSITHT
jgi:hypothetical protein